MKKNMKLAKYSIIIIIILLFSMIVWKIEEGGENNEKESLEKDNYNIINNIGNQSFDKAQQIYINSRTGVS